MAKIEYKVCVVTVTYGDRWKFLKQVLKRVLEFKVVSDIIVVDNASLYPVAEQIKELGSDRIVTITQKENLGSAGGYKTGLEYASSLDCDFVFLLDDDNLPGDTCLENLLEKRQSNENIDKNDAVYCLREDRQNHVAIAKGEDPYRFYLTSDNFLGFNVFRIPYNQYKKFCDRKKKKLKGSEMPQEAVKIPYVPYGGLLLPKSLLLKIGLPDERYHLYVDDTEYTYRITRKSSSIWLIPSCKITDIDRSVGIGYKGAWYRSPLLDLYSFRTYYHVRNMIYFNKRFALKNKIVYSINKQLYLSALAFSSILTGKRDEYKSILVAVRDGSTGQLGKKI
ncbi:glycosyltransferase [Desertivirga brevis]|uniref:glycosyltransferase n=1 Tax=Desertivirga brevis TaxID=2810310 RepID=UPI001A97ABE0|nr:glycosyltransferase [Pedobacter sp. SYSU D00873]